ncbi:MAG: class IV adenylate cyclase [bacterium]|nr:class IV adenylate cyclase [bacterium]
MPANIEIKAALPNPEEFRIHAESLSDSHQVLHQKDTFFAVNKGRLKLRCFPEGNGELIQYERSNRKGPKHSRYSIIRTPDPENLEAVLSEVLGVIGVVKKTRDLFMVGQTRIHLDSVENLGLFVELEVVLKENQSTEEGEFIATELMQKLNIKQDDLLEMAYIDMLLSSQSTTE